MKPLIVIFTFLLILSCDNRTSKKADKAEELGVAMIKTEPRHMYSKKYKANENSDFEAQFDTSLGGLSIYLTLSKVLSFPKQMKELKVILSKAEKDYNMKSLETVDMDLLPKSGDLIVDICSVPEIQAYLKECKKTNNSAIDYNIIGKYALKSKYIQLLLNCFRPYSIRVNYIAIEKCMFCTLEELQNVEINPENKDMNVMYSALGIDIRFENQNH